MRRAVLALWLFSVASCAVASGDDDSGQRDVVARTDGALDAHDAMVEVAPADVTLDVSVCSPIQTECGGHCVDVHSDSMNCGACGTVCPASQFCNNGTCSITCNPPRMVCGATCTDPTTDTANCGTCGHACGAMQTCVAGACACPTGMTLCGGACVDAMTDMANCGTCGTACPAVQHCAAGVCACRAGGMLCSGACVDAMTDMTNCGSCGTICPAGQTCSAGSCACASGQMLCGSACVDPRVDTMNCGSCGHACATGQFCAIGMCFCAAGRVACSAGCTDITTDMANCGACGNACPAVATCASSICVCPGGQTACGTTCTNLASDSSNCGTCGTVCPSGTTCTGSVCACPGGGSVCGSTCVDLQSSDTSCGTCGTSCTAPAHCHSGTCSTLTNDECTGATAITIGAGTTTVAASNVGATMSAAGCMGGTDVWYSFTLAQNELVYVDTFGAGFDTRVGLVNACGAAATCNDNACTLSQSQVIAVLPAGTHYIVVGGLTQQAFNLHVQHIPVPGPVNGTLANSFSAAGNNAGAPTFAFSCGGGSAAETNSWYWLSCPSSPAGSMSANTCSASWDTELMFTNGDGSAGACNDDSCGLESSISGTVPAGAGLHVVQIRGYSTGETGAYTISGTHP